MSIRFVQEDGVIGLQAPSDPVCKVEDFGGELRLTFEHDCVNSEGQAHRGFTVLRTDKFGGLDECYPTWSVTCVEPLSLVPSIKCGSCSTHGFFRHGVWIPA